MHLMDVHLIELDIAKIRVNMPMAFSKEEQVENMRRYRELIAITSNTNPVATE